MINAVSPPIRLRPQAHCGAVGTLWDTWDACDSEGTSRRGQEKGIYLMR